MTIRMAICWPAFFRTPSTRAARRGSDPAIQASSSAANQLCKQKEWGEVLGFFPGRGGAG